MWFKDVIMLNWDFIWKQTIGIFVQEMYVPLLISIKASMSSLKP